MQYPKKIPIKLNEGENYEYLDVENPYKHSYDSSSGGTSTVGVVDGDSSETKSPIELHTVRNQYWMDRALGGGRGFNYSTITTSKDKLKESMEVLNFLTERDVIVVPSQEPPMEEDPNMNMGGEEEMPIENEPNADIGGEEDIPMEEEDPNITALMQLLQQSADRKTIEAVKKYAEGVISAKGEEEPPMEEDPNMNMGGEEEMPMENDPNAGMSGAQQPQQQTENRILDEFINDYLTDTEKKQVPTVSKKTGTNSKSSLKSKMFNPLK